MSTVGFAHYNRAKEPTVTVRAGAMMYRVADNETFAEWGADTFRSTGIAPLVDFASVDIHQPPLNDKPYQGRFDPVHDDPAQCPGGKSLGGYIYLGETPDAAILEGVIRNKPRTKTGRIRPSWFAGKSIATIQLNSDIEVIPFDDPDALLRMGMDAGIWSSSWERYSHTRVSGTNALVVNETSHGIRYPCRHGSNHNALMLVERNNPPELSTLSISTFDDPDDLGMLLLESFADRRRMYIPPDPLS